MKREAKSLICFWLSYVAVQCAKNLRLPIPPRWRFRQAGDSAKLKIPPSSSFRQSTGTSTFGRVLFFELTVRRMVHYLWKVMSGYPHPKKTFMELKNKESFKVNFFFLNSNAVSIETILSEYTRTGCLLYTSDAADER